MRRIIHITRMIWLLLTASAGSAVADDKISLQQVYDTGMTVIEIETVNGELPAYERVDPPQGAMGYGIRNATKVPGRLRILKGKEVVFDSGAYKEKESGMTIKVRGNTTALAPKKPYKIKLQQKADLLLRGDENKFQDKDWLLILDESLSAKTGFKLSELAGMEWTPAYEYVNLILNGEYMGLYMLCESVSRNRTCRLDVDKTGYIFEYDAYWWNEKVYVESSRDNIPMHYTFKYPDADDITDEQIAYFTEMIQRAEASMRDGTYKDYIDVNSFVTWIMLHDILGSQDAAGANYYFTKYDNTDASKVRFALLWDFDMVFICQEDWSVAHKNGWYFYNYLFENEDFIKAFTAQWQALSPTIFDQLFSYLEAYAASEEAKAFDASVELDNLLWDKDRRPADQRTKGIITWLTRQKAWMDSAVAEMATTVGIRPAWNASQEDDGYYSLTGQKTVSPQKGIYIHQGRKRVMP